MKKRIMFIFLFVFLFICLGIVGIKINELLNIPNVKKEEIEQFEILNIKEDTDKYILNVYYPTTKYEMLNETISLEVNEYINSFRDELVKLSNDKKYSLEITFETYSTKDTISFLFNVSENLGCLHGEKYVFSINFNVKKNKIINISDLILENESLLEKLQNKCYDALIQNDDIKNAGVEEFVKEGTKPEIKNYDTFILNDKSITIYFGEYQVVPYYLGIQKVEVLLSELYN